MIDHCFGICIGEQIAQFFFYVAVVHVERCCSSLIATEHSLDVLVTVVHIEGNVVLARLVALELIALSVAAKALCMQIRS